MNKIKEIKMKIDKKVIGAGLVVASAIPAFAEGEEPASGGAMASLDNLNTALTTLNTKATTIMEGLAALALVIVVGIIVLKLTKKGSRAG